MKDHLVKINHGHISRPSSQEKREPSRFRHVPPGLITIGGLYKVYHCSHCGLVAISEDRRPCEQCWACGNWQTVQKKARWVSERKWYNPLTWGNGYWSFKA